MHIDQNLGSDETPPLLSVRNLRTTFRLGNKSEITAIDGVSFELKAGRTVAIVGESGSGKSVTSLSVMGLLPKGVGRVTDGDIVFDGRSLVDLPEKDMARLRGRDIGMIFQEPMTSLNPVHRIGAQISETLIHHEGMTKAQARVRALELLELVGIPEAKRRIDAYPHELSGGMRQRAMIAMALACSPRLLIADEPTTALDVTIQAQMLELMQDLQDKMGMAIIFITHDLGVVAEMADDVVVMYCGEVVESGPVAEIFADPRMPYTRGLLGSMPGQAVKTGGKGRLRAIRGAVPPLTDLPAGCRFNPRCDFATDLCRASKPALETDGAHATRCLRWRDLSPSSQSPEARA